MNIEQLADPPEPTSNHVLIRDWALRHHAVPAEVRRRVFDGQPAVLRFLFGAAKEGTAELCPISWDEFFAHFDLLHMALVLDESPAFAFIEAESPNPYLRSAAN